ncbi:hypothetical protein D3C72_2108450 [compost metagenome]
MHGRSLQNHLLALQAELHAIVAGGETQAFIEPPRIRARAVGGELDQAASLDAALFDRPFEHGAPQALAARRRGDAHALDLSAPLALTRQAGYER